MTRTRLPMARPRWQVRLELVAKVAILAFLLGAVFVAMTSVDPELVSRGLG